MLITHVERLIIDEDNKSAGLSKEHRRETVAYLMGYLQALKDTDQLNTDEYITLTNTVSIRFAS